MSVFSEKNCRKLIKRGEKEISNCQGYGSLGVTPKVDNIQEQECWKKVLI